MIKRLLKPIIDDAYKRGYEAGVYAEKLLKDDDRNRREYDLLRRGVELGREEMLREMEAEIEEIDAQEFNELTKQVKPFGFVGTIDDIGLILDEAN